MSIDIVFFALKKDFFIISATEIFLIFSEKKRRRQGTNLSFLDYGLYSETYKTLN